MFDLERTARRLADRLLIDVPFDNVQKAKVEYGLSLLLGVVTELFLALAVSAVLGTALFTLIIMLSALALRLFTGGAHCSSFRRCLVFTIVCFISLSFPVKTAVNTLEFEQQMWIAFLLILLTLPLIWKPNRLTLLIWTICASLPVIGLLGVFNAGWRILILPIAAGLVFQAFMFCPLGHKVVQGSDKIMKQLGI